MNRSEWEENGMQLHYWKQQYEPKTPAQERVLEAVRGYIAGISEWTGKFNSWARESRVKGVLLMGEPGTGKTLLAHRILNAAHNRGHGVMALRFADYVDACRELMKDWDPYAHEIVRRALVVHYLLLDDLGKEHSGATDYVLSLFRELTRHRVGDMLPTIITTNLNPGEIVGAYSKAEWSNLQGSCVVIPTDDEDYRVL